MARFTISTPHGEVWLHGDREPSKAGGPVLLAITGAFAHETRQSVFHLQPLMPGLDVYAAHLPGNHCPKLSAATVDVWGEAYRDAASAFGSRPLTVLGESTGALIALAMRPTRSILLEPPLTPASIAPLIPTFQRQAKDPRWADFLSGVYGVTENAVEPRDRLPLLDTLAGPCLAVCGDPEAAESPPSLVGEVERAAFAAHPLVRSVFVPGAGHNLFRTHGNGVVRLVREWASPSASAGDSGRSSSPTTSTPGYASAAPRR